MCYARARARVKQEGGAIWPDPPRLQPCLSPRSWSQFCIDSLPTKEEVDSGESTLAQAGSECLAARFGEGGLGS